MFIMNDKDKNDLSSYTKGDRGLKEKLEAAQKISIIRNDILPKSAPHKTPPKTMLVQCKVKPVAEANLLNDDYGGLY